MGTKIDYEVILDQFFGHMLIDINKIAVATSGGSDSLALTFLLADYLSNKNILLETVTIDHGLRAESRDEAIYVNNLMSRYCINHTIITLDNIKQQNNMQSNARIARYNSLEKFCEHLKIKYLCVGHTHNDVAENFLIRLRRGSGIDGLAAMAEKVVLNNITILRPLLTVKRSDLKEFLQGRQIRWINDPTNYNTQFERVKVRKILGNHELYIKRIVMAANHLKLAKNYLETKVDNIISNYCTLHDEGFVTIAYQDFINLHEYEMMSIICRILQFCSGNFFKPRIKILNRILSSINQSYFKKATIMGIIIHKYKDQILFYREVKQNIPILITKTTFIWDNRLKITIPPYLVKEKLKIVMLTLQRWQTLDKKLVKADQKFNLLPKAIFYSFPTFIKLEKIVAIPHINYIAKKDYASISLKFNVSNQFKFDLS